MNPLKQGLKQRNGDFDITFHYLHLSMNPLKQGLKHEIGIALPWPQPEHLSMNPLKQGLKHRQGFLDALKKGAFIHESIKTRVETGANLQGVDLQSGHLSMNPLKQGLKPDTNPMKHTRESLHLSMNPLKQGLKLPYSWESSCTICGIYP